MKTKIIRGALLCALLLASGCGTTSIRATKVDVGKDQAGTLPCKFRLASYSFSLPDNLNRKENYEHPLWSVPASAGKLSRPAVEAILLKTYPDVFSTDASALPVSVSVSVKESKSAAQGEFVSMFTSLARILPSKDVDLIDHCEINVAVCGETREGGVKATLCVGFCSEDWFSLFTPIALCMTGNERDFGGVSRVWKGLFACVPAEMQREVFKETLAAAVLAALQKMDENEVKRMALMRAVRVE
jgi:hypothetical protein